MTGPGRESPSSEAGRASGHRLSPCPGLLPVARDQGRVSAARGSSSPPVGVGIVCQSYGIMAGLRKMAIEESGGEVQLGAQGRLVIPAPLRKALKLEPGDRLVARRVGESLVLERREVVERRLKERFRRIPPGVSLADELIAERRAEAEVDRDGSGG